MPLPDWLLCIWTNRDEIIRLGTPIIGLIGGAVGIWLLYIRTRAADRTAQAALEQARVAAAQAKTAADRHEEQTKADRESRITESFAKAVEQLGSDKLETRLGAIYTLERISRESEREYWPIMETLTAYVREHAPWPPRQALSNPFVQLQGSITGEAPYESTPVEPQKETKHTRDIQAILNVLGRRDETARKQDEAAMRSISLAATDLRYVGLRAEAHLEGANLIGAHLKGADLPGVHLESAWLMRAHFDDAWLVRATLTHATLTHATLTYAKLREAHLEGADLRGADLRKANLEGANLGEEFDTFYNEEGMPRSTLVAADLEHAHLEGANLVGANLRGADLRKANLEGANLEGANLEGANLRKVHLKYVSLAETVGLTQEQLETASGNDRTPLPEGLTRPRHWPAAAPDETV